MTTNCNPDVPALPLIRSIGLLASQNTNFPTPGIQGESVVNSKPLTFNNNASARSASGLSLENGAPTYAPQTTDAGVGQFRGFGYDRPDRSPEHIAKAKAFLAWKQKARKDPANCQRCGKPRDNEKKTCAKCLRYQAKYRGSLADEKMTAAMVVAAVKQMRREIDRMQARFKLWQKAAHYRRNLHYQTNRMRKKYLKTVSHAQAMDYLAETNHAYDNDKTQAG